MESAYFYLLLRGGSEYDVDSDIEERICIFILVVKRNFENFVLRHDIGVLSVDDLKTRVV